MKIKLFVILAVVFLATILFIPIDKVLSQRSSELVNIRYPVEELNNCKSESDCKTYCDNPDNHEACFAFAEKNNLMSKEEIRIAKKFLSNDIKSLGGCKTKDICEEYCNDMNHIDECISFAEENDLIPPEGLEDAKKVQSAIARGIKPPPCGNKKSCDIYCESPEHMEECITFGIEAGFIQGEELEDVQKMLQAIKRGVKPPPCKGREECDAYCGQEEHFEECTNFAEAAGFMTAEEAIMARKTGGKGPGDCKNKQECEDFCNNPDNQEACFLFGKKNRTIPEENLKRMEEGKQQMRKSLEQAPSAILDCLQSEIGPDMMEKIKSGAVAPPREISDKMNGCFQKNQQQGNEGPYPNEQYRDDINNQPTPATSFFIRLDFLVASAVNSFFNFLFNR